MTIKKFAVTAVLAAGSLAAAPAYAQVGQQDVGFYIGGSFGTSETDIDTNILALGGFTVTGKDERDEGWKIFGGYQFHRNWGVEVGYYDLGTFNVSGRFGAIPFAADVDVRGWGFFAVGTFPLNEKFSVFGKAGAFYSEQKGAAVAGGTVVVFDDKNTDFAAGIGLKFNVTRNLAIRAEVEHLRLGSSDSVNYFSIGGQFRF